MAMVVALTCLKDSPLPSSSFLQAVDDREVAADARRLAIRDDGGGEDEADVGLARELFQRQRGDLRLDVEVAQRVSVSA